MMKRKWNVEITKHDAGLWSVYGTAADDTGDHMGSNVAGTEKDARAYAADTFGADATITVKRPRAR